MSQLRSDFSHSASNQSGPAKVSTAIAVKNQQNLALSQEQLEEIAYARKCGKKINFAALMASISGWSLAVFAFLSIIFGIFDIVTFLLGVGMGVNAYYELRGAKGLKNFKPEAARHLALNQLCLAAILIIYASWGLVYAIMSEGAYADQIAAGGKVAEMLEPIAALNKLIMIAVYSAVMLFSLLVPGLTAWYYASRRKHIIDYLEDTPEWVVTTLRTAAA